MSRSFSDDFTRADNVDLGANWDAGYSPDGPAQIVGNAVRATTLATAATETTNAVTGLADCWAQATLKTFTGAQAAALRVILRTADSPTDTLYMFNALRNAGGNTSQIDKFVAGANSGLASEAATTWVAGDILRAEVRGDQLTLYRNGVLLLTVTDATLTSGRIGISLYEDTGGSLANVELDDFSGGASCEITGTAIASITEADVRAGGKTIIATLANQAFIAN